MDSVAELGLRIDSSGVTSAEAALNRLSPAAIAAEQAVVKLTGSAASASIAARDSAAAVAAETTAVIASVAAKQQLKQANIDSATSARAAAAAKGQLSQLDDYAARLEINLANQTLKVASAQDAVTQSIRSYITARAQANQTSGLVAQAYQSNINQVTGVQSNEEQDAVTATQAANVKAYGDALDQLRAKFNPIFAASKQYETAIDEVNQAQAVGAINADETSTALETERLKFEQASLAANNLGNAHSGLNFQSIEAFRAVHNLVLSVAGGVSPTQALTRGISELSFAASGPGGLSGAFSGLGKLIAGFITPTTATVTVLAAAAAGIGYLAQQAEVTGKAFDNSLAGVGRMSGVTSAQLQMMADTAASSSDIAIGSARSWAESYAASGAVVGNQIGTLTQLTQNYAATTHEDADDAAKELTSSFTDLGTGIDTLGKKLGGLDDTTRQHIKDLVAQGDQYDAVNLALKYVAGNTADYDSTLTHLGHSWHNFTSDLSQGSAGLQRLFSPTTLDKLQVAQAMLDDAKHNNNHLTQDSGGNLVSQQALQGEVNRLQASLNADLAKAGKAARDAYLIALTLKAGELSQALTPDSTSVQNIINNIAILAKSSVETPQTTAAILGQKSALDSLADSQGEVIYKGNTYLSQQQIMQKQDQLSIQSIYAKSPAQKQSIAEQQMALSLTGQNISAEDRANRIRLAGQQALQTTTKALGDQNQALDYNTKSIIGVAAAYTGNDLPAVLAITAHYQAESEAITQAINVRAREQQLILQAVGQRISSAAQEQQTTALQTKAQGEANTSVLQGTLAYDRLSDAVSNKVRDAQLEQLRTAALATGNTELVATIDKIIEAYKELDKVKPANDNIAAVLGLTNPNASDITTAKTAAQLKASGQINGNQQNLVNSKLGLQSDVNSVAQGIGSANPFSGGKIGVDNSIVQIQQKQAQDLQTVQDGLQAGLIKSEQDAAAMRIQINENATNQIKAAYTNLYTSQLQMGADAFAGLADSVGQLAGKSSAAYKILFGVSKAFSIAQATLNLEVAISNALALPFPANIPAMAAAAAAGATIISDIASIAGFAGGVVGFSGAGTGTSDSNLVRLSNGESVVTAAGTQGNQGTLAAMNQGASFDKMSAGMAGAKIIVNNNNGSNVRIRQLSSGEIEMMIDDKIIKATPAIAKQANKQVPNAVAKANASPRMRQR